MTTRVLRLRWPGACAACSRELPAGTTVSWDGASKLATCAACAGGEVPAAEAVTPTAAIDAGVAGASARREYERRSTRERSRKERAVAEDKAWREKAREEHPIIGRIASVITPKVVITPESQSTRAWAEGAAGEERVGALLDASEEVVVLHDRRVPKSKANIDHLVIGPSGVFVVDPKKYQGEVEKRHLGGWFSKDERLFVDRRDRTKLVETALWQRDVVRGVLDDDAVPVHAVLCFVGAEWPLLFAKPLSVRGVTVAWPTRTVELVAAPGPWSPEQVTAVAERLAAELRPA